MRATFLIPLLVVGVGCDVEPLFGEKPPDDRPDDEPDLPEPDLPEQLTANLRVDANRDGVINRLDDEGEDRFDADVGAIVIANVDDDDGDGNRDSRDDVLSVESDREDMSPAIIRGIAGADGHTLHLTLEPAAARERVRVWRDDGAPSILLDPNVAAGEATFEAVTDDVPLLVEALVPRAKEWDGSITLTLTLEKDGDVISTDVVAMRAAPVIFPDNTQAPEVLYVMDIPGDNDAFVDAMRAAMPAGVDLYTLDEQSYGYDRWVQDNMELGVQTRPRADGSVQTMRTAMQLQRGGGWGGGLEAFVPYEYLAGGHGYLYPGGASSSHNYGGNLEVAPPHDGYPFGRMLYGGGDGGTLLGRPSSDTMNQEQLAFLDAQEVQAPALRLSSEWLAVGHIDEIFQFVPDTVSDGNPYKVVIASPALARDALLAVQSRGGGGLAVFSGRDPSYTVDEILGADEFLALNEAAQRRIDEVQATLMSALGLDDGDFLPVPVLYEEQGGGLVAAFNPGVQNLVTVGDRLFLPDPEGPREDGVDVWQEATRASLSTLELDLIFVDVFYSYHLLLGEAHCGTNVDRAAYDAAWWTEAP